MNKDVDIDKELLEELDKYIEEAILERQWPAAIGGIRTLLKSSRESILLIFQSVMEILQCPSVSREMILSFCEVMRALPNIPNDVLSDLLTFEINTKLLNSFDENLYECYIRFYDNIANTTKTEDLIKCGVLEYFVWKNCHSKQMEKFNLDKNSLLERSLSHLEEIDKIDYPNPSKLKIYFELLFESGNHEKLISLMKHYTSIPVPFIQYFEYYLHFHEKLKMNETADLTFTLIKLSQLDPCHPLIEINLFLLLENEGKYDETLDILFRRLDCVNNCYCEKDLDKVLLLIEKVPTETLSKMWNKYKSSWITYTNQRRFLSDTFIRSIEKNNNIHIGEKKRIKIEKRLKCLSNIEDN